MSNKEQILEMMSRFSDRELGYVVYFMNAMNEPDNDDSIPTVEPDEWDLEMIARAEAEYDGTTITLDELAKELGIDPIHRRNRKTRLKIHKKATRKVPNETLRRYLRLTRRKRCQKNGRP